MAQTEPNHIMCVDAWTELRDRVNLLVTEETQRHSSAIHTLSILLAEAQKNKEDLMLMGIAIRVSRTEEEADKYTKQFHELRLSSRFQSMERFSKPKGPNAT